ncbi:rhamnulokinase [Alkalicoccus daliensis]|uniref:Rhamnulokinase n=1 Tax=Alkalicoccus daliensis TaxID=745820 RepID=A0A1H0F185_9BACI|nr:rhamnulokinase [Alkalicoccus daliensis]SDN88299.1 L-rhamnulokinase [Alkalicoccus daliensis]
MSSSSLAVDIGASSGRLILGSLENNTLNTKEIHRFENKMIQENGYECWDIEHLHQEILTGIRKAFAMGERPASIGIDTWAVDYVLLDKENQPLMKPIAYRDQRTKAVIEEVHALLPQEELYRRTGIQYQPFNTIYQLAAHKKQEPELWEKAEKLLLIPDYLHFLLTGRQAAEYTNATTTQLISAETGEWDKGTLDTLGIPHTLFPELRKPGETLGPVKEELQEEFGVEMNVVFPGTHDTASAVAAAPIKDKAVYISSGTWSLMGVEEKEPVISKETREKNFTNEGGVENRFRFLKNIMGLWMIQEVKREYNDKYSFAEFVELAKESALDTIVNVNEERFLRPESMKEAIKESCSEQGEEVPEEPGDFARCIFRSLAASYASTVNEIEALTGEQYERIHVIGGGSQNQWLNQLTADFTGKQVISGPVEATAIGNLLVQFIAQKQISSLEKGREVTANSFSLVTYLPEEG